MVGFWSFLGLIFPNLNMWTALAIMVTIFTLLLILFTGYFPVKPPFLKMITGFSILATIIMWGVAMVTSYVQDIYNSNPVWFFVILSVVVFLISTIILFKEEIFGSKGVGAIKK